MVAGMEGEGPPAGGGASHLLSIRPTSEAVKASQQAAGATSNVEVRQQVEQGVKQALTSAGAIADVRRLAQQSLDIAQNNADALAGLKGSASVQTATTQQVLVASQNVRDELRL
eukprot:4395849-Pyramimonas_sp.AAC.1